MRLNTAIQPREPSFKHLPRVRELMTSEPISLSEAHSVQELQDLMSWRGIRHVPVTDSSGKLVGLVTQRDFLTIAVSKLAHLPKFQVEELYKKIPIGEIMGRKVATVSPEAPLAEAAELMFKNKFGCLPVVNSEGVLVGILTEADFVRAFAEWEARFIDRA